MTVMTMTIEPSGRVCEILVLTKQIAVTHKDVEGCETPVRTRKDNG
jgi:hypothetical protein